MWIMLAIVAAVVVYAIYIYNRLVSTRQMTEEAWSGIDVQLKRRSDLIPNLVNTVKGFAAQEQAVFTAVADARARLNGAIQSGDPEQMSQANGQLTGALGRLLAISERYPELRSNENFLRLQDELSGTENRIATARSDYNAAVEAYNSYIRAFPQIMTAKITGAQPRKYFDADPASRETPTVDFSAPAPATPPAQPTPPAPTQ
jgi:LemA protein